MQITSKAITFIAFRFGLGMTIEQLSETLNVSTASLRIMESQLLNEAKDNDKMGEAWDSLMKDAARNIREREKVRKEKTPQKPQAPHLTLLDKMNKADDFFSDFD